MRRQGWCRSKEWYSVRAEQDIPEVFIFDAIDIWGVDAESFVKEIGAIDSDQIRLRINSPGGNVFDGAAMISAIRNHRATVEARVEGVAASMAAILAMAADDLVMAEESFMMVHPPWALVVGNADDMRGMANTLDKIDDNHLGIVARRTGRDIETLRDEIGQELWMDASEAVEWGFADSMDGATEAAARFDMSCYHHTPKALRSSMKQPATKTEIERTLTRQCGLTRTEAREMLSHYKANERDADGLLGDIQSLTDRMRDAVADLQSTEWSKSHERRGAKISG